MNPKKFIFSKKIIQAALIAFFSLGISNMATAFQAQNHYHEDTILVAQLLEKAIGKYHHDYDGALEDAQKALKISQLHNDKSWTVKSHHRIGRIYESNNHLVEALFYYQNELVLVNQVPNILT
jgi:hypothetical protein